MNSAFKKGDKMYTAIIENVLDCICESLTKKWYGYDTNTVLRDNFISDVMSYDYIVNEKWLEYLFIHCNIETKSDSILIDESVYNKSDYDNIIHFLKKYDNESLYDVSIQEIMNNYHIYVYEYTNTIKKITCDYKYLSNYEYNDIFE